MHGMTSHELYKATRGVWKLGERRRGAKYALAVFDKVVREVYTIEEWHRAGTLPYVTRRVEEVNRSDRWEFSGRIAPELVRDHYLHRSVEAYFRRGQQSPVSYVNM